MFKLRRSSVFSSSLYDQNGFYLALSRDLEEANHQVVIESPFITQRRTAELLPILKNLTNRGVSIIVNTKPMDEHEQTYALQVENAIRAMQEVGIKVLFTVGHHRKLVILDERITWEGSLNILSQNDSCEFMRRIESKQVATQTLRFLRLNKFIR